MNYMKVVAQLLGVEIGEEFKIEGHSGNVKYRLTEENLEYLSSCDHWFSISSTLNCLLNDQYKVAKMPILDDAEKRYLKGVIRPFRNRIKCIRKCIYPTNDFEWIEIVPTKGAVLGFPDFEPNTMYKNMKLNKEYTLEELGL